MKKLYAIFSIIQLICFINTSFAQQNNALSFDGVNDYVSVGSVGLPSINTREFWFKPNNLAIGLNQYFMDFGGNNYWIQLFDVDGDDKLELRAGGGSVTYVDGIAEFTDTSRWYYVAVTVDSGKTLTIYINGNYDNSGSVHLGTPGALVLGIYGGHSLPFNGKIDEVRIWKTVRTQAQIQSDMNSRVLGDTAGLVAYYPFNEGIADSNNTNILTADDVTSNHNNGTLNNFALTGHKSNWVEGVPNIDLQDSLALVDLYNSTNGPTWTNKENWLTKNPVSTWYGITVSGINVTGITLSKNQLSGHIPVHMGKLTALEHLHLDSNQLNGPIPSSIGKLTNLEVLNLSHNNLRDSIPSSLGNCSKLRILRLSFNGFTGNIPSSFSSLTSLRVLDVGSNNLAGSVPAFLTTLPKLRILGLMHNHYTFDGIEGLVQHDFDTLRYWGQKKIQVHQNGNILSTYAGGTLSHNTYTWYKDGALAATITGDSTFTAPASGDYYVHVTNSIATALTLRSDTISVSTLKAAPAAGNAIVANGMDKNSYPIYPNPVRDVLHLDNLKSNSTISIITQDGRVVDKKVVSGSSYVWNVKDLAAGSYYVRIEKDKAVSVVMFVKQ
jgi:hypothetical protein